LYLIGSSIVSITTSVVKGIICEKSCLALWMGGHVVNVERKEMWGEAGALRNAGIDAFD